MTAVLPIKVLKVAVTSVTSNANWPSDSSPYAGVPYRWTVHLNVTAQGHSSPSTTTPYYYNGSDIAIGDWLSNAVGGFAWQIKSISAQTGTAITCVVEDVDQFNTYSDPNGNGDGSPPNLQQGFVYSLVTSGQPVLGPLIPNILTGQWATDLIARYTYLNPGSISSAPTLSVSDAVISFNPGPATANITGTTPVSGLPTLAFGTSSVSVPATPKSFTITNTGDSALTIASAIATGDFRLTVTPSSTVVASGNTVAQVTFTPTATGSRIGTLTITSNAASSPDVVNLTGTGGGMAWLSTSGSTIVLGG